MAVKREYKVWRSMGVRMPKPYIRYRDGYKYQVVEDYDLMIDIKPAQDIETDFIHLDATGLLTIKKGYAWDGPSGPTIDTKNFMRGSLVHDALYQLMRNEHLTMEHRDAADRLLQSLCREDGMTRLRAWLAYKAVKKFGKPAASPESRKPIHIAP